MKQKDIEEAIKTLMEVYYAAKDFLNEPSAIYKAARIEELKKAVQVYEETYWKRFGGRDERP